MELTRLRARYLAVIGVPGLCVALSTGCDHPPEPTRLVPSTSPPSPVVPPGTITATPAVDAATETGADPYPVAPGRHLPVDAAVRPIAVGHVMPRGRVRSPPPPTVVGRRRVDFGRTLAASEAHAPSASPVAPALARDDWSDAALSLDVSHLPHEARSALSAWWSSAAASEHASVAAFARESLRLALHGAPPALLIAAHEAALDEVRHARIAYTLASAFGGAALGPGALGADGTHVSLATLAREAFLAGAVNEAVSAQLLREAAHEAGDTELARALDTMADDEERHADLAFRTLVWALRVGGETVAIALREAADEARALARAPDGAMGPRAHETLLTSHGVLHPSREREIQRRVIDEVVLPCVDALLGHC